jgi:protoheme IX farnesyltransferase
MGAQLDMESAAPLNASVFFSDSLALVKPRITLLAIITTVVGMVLAPVPISLSKAIFTIVGVSLLVGGASALNMFLERDVDYLMERTRDRPLPGKRLTPEYGLGLGSLLIGISIPLLILYVNPLTGWVGFISLATYVLIYTPLKKRSSLSLWVGAIPGAAPPLLGWTAATASLALPAWVLFGIIFFWQIPHFLAIGTFRREEYARAGFKIFPLKQKPATVKWQMLIFTLVMFPMSLALVPLGYGGRLYFGTALTLNILFFGAALGGLIGKDEEKWGKRIFFVSLIYLTVLFLLMFLDGGSK